MKERRESKKERKRVRERYREQASLNVREKLIVRMRVGSMKEKREKKGLW